MRPALLMLASVLLFSWIPPAMAYGNASASPYLFGSLVRSGIIIISGGWTAGLCLKTAEPGRTARNLLRETTASALSPYIIACGIAQLNMAVMALGAARLGYPAAAVIYEIWPLPTALLIGAATSGSRYPRMDRFTVAAMLCCTAGVGLALTGADPGAWNKTGGAGNLTAGAALVLLSAAVTSLSALSWKWAAGLRERTAEAGTPVNELHSLMAGLTVAASYGAAACAAVGLLSGESIAPSSMTVALISGTMANGGGAALWRAANAASGTLSLNALCYLIPLLSLAWLWAAGEQGEANPSLMLCGAAAVAGGNAALGLRGRSKNRQPAESAL